MIQRMNRTPNEGMDTSAVRNQLVMKEGELAGILTAFPIAMESPDRQHKVPRRYQD